MWANPFRIGSDGNRTEVIEKFQKHLLGKPELLARLPELAGMRLLCHCGLHEPCHGDVLISEFGKHAVEQVAEDDGTSTED